MPSGNFYSHVVAGTFLATTFYPQGKKRMTTVYKRPIRKQGKLISQDLRFCDLSNGLATFDYNGWPTTVQCPYHLFPGESLSVDKVEIEGRDTFGSYPAGVWVWVITEGDTE